MGDDELTVFVGNLAFNAVPGDIDDLFAGLNLDNARLVHDRETGKFRGFAYVQFKDRESAEKALEKDGIVLLERQIKVSPANKRQRGGPRTGGQNQQRRPMSGGNFSQQRDRQIPSQPPYTAYVGNFNYNTVEDDLAGFFEGLAIEEVRIVRDRETNQSKGHGYVDFKDSDSLEKALTADGVDWNGRNVKVDLANERRSGSGGFQRRGGYGSGGGFGMGGGRERDGYGSGFRNTPSHQEEFKVPTADDEKQRKKIILQPRTKPVEEIGKVTAPSGKEDPFGGARPRDEFAYQKKKEEAVKPEKSETSTPK